METWIGTRAIKTNRARDWGERNSKRAGTQRRQAAEPWFLPLKVTMKEPL